MLKLIVIDLSKSDQNLFTNYEDKVLALIPKHGGQLAMRVRSIDGYSGTHLIYCPDVQAFESFRSDPVRLAASSEWERSGARSVVTDVERIGSNR